MISRLLLYAAIALACAVPCAATSPMPPLPPNTEATVISTPCPPLALTLNGTASMDQGGVVRLTSDKISQAGSAFTTEAVDVSHFDTSFSFYLSGIEEEQADGITFCIQSDPNGPRSLGSLGGYLGYGNSEPWGTPGITKSIAVEFDDYRNEEFGDLPTQHIGIDTCGSVISNAQVASPVQLVDDVVSARVVYDGKILNVYVWSGRRQPHAPILRYKVDIPALVAPTAYVGFTSATAKSYESADVTSWTFGLTSIVPVKSSKAPTAILD